MYITLDYAPGLHGQFLELVINKYIYGIPYNGDIFYWSGAAHKTSKNKEYQESKIVHHKHCSAFGVNYSEDTEKVIFIELSEKLDFVFLVNIFYRCHPNSSDDSGVSASEIAEMHREFLGEDSKSDLLCRQNWFAKLNERLFVEHALMKLYTNIPRFNFNYESFFNLKDFCNELQLTAKFLGETFKFDSSLSDLWQEFIDRNQGWQLYQQGNSIIESTLANKNIPIPDNWQLHTYLNFQLSKLFDLHDGPLYNNDTYPASSTELLAVITNHLNSFDSRW